MADEIRPNLPEGMTVVVGSDDSLFISRAIDKVWVTLAEAAVLVVAVIFLFLGSWRATLIPAVTVPLCLLASFAVLWMFGFSINLLTLLAMVLSIGIVVDDAIVVLENVYHRIEEGEPPLAAAFEGSRQVGFAIISTTLVVCAVFVPVMFITGQTGLLFRELAVAMIGAIAFSGFLALSLAPMLCSKLLRQEKRRGLAAWVDNGFQRLEARYRSGLDRVIRKPLFPSIFVGIFLAGAGQDPAIDRRRRRSRRDPAHARRLRRQRRFQFRHLHRFPQALGGARGDDPGGRPGGQQDPRAAAGGPRQRASPVFDRRKGEGPARPVRDRGQQLPGLGAGAGPHNCRRSVQSRHHQPRQRL
jgi:hypothetical protein